MTDAELRKLVDRGRVIKDTVDILEVEQEGIKKTLREEAKARKLDHFLGNKHFSRVSPQTSTVCEPSVVYETFQELDRNEEFFDCVKVKITETKAALGETLLASISSTRSEAYKKVSFLASIPKKYLKK